MERNRPYVKPIALKEREDGQLEVEVHAIVKNRLGDVVSDDIALHLPS
jgi:hypothetical protein